MPEYINGREVWREPWIFRPTVEDKVSDQIADITLTWAMTGQHQVINSASAVIVTLPNADASHVGGYFKLSNKGTGRLTVQLGANDYVDDSNMGGTVYTDDDYIPTMVIKLAKFESGHGYWVFEAANGVWVTT